LDPVLRLAGEEEFEMAGDDADYRDSERQLRRSRRRPTADELWEEILPRIQQDPSVQVVFAGEGEPLLRLPTLLDLVRRVRKETDGQSTIRVTTNGLLPEAPSSSLSVVERDEQAMGAVAMAEIAAARRLAEAGVQCLSVALMTSDPDQYDEIMRPVVRIDNDGDPRRAHERACDMIRAGIKTGLQVEITAVEGPGVSKSALERFASSMFSGTAHAAAVPVRWRTYFA
jgi:molybdenum cofactor biosynthesis enzyme MoaA